MSGPIPRAGIIPLATLLDAFPQARVIVEVKDDSVELARPSPTWCSARGPLPAGSASARSTGRSCGRYAPSAPDLTTSASQPEARALLLRSHLRWPRFGRAPFAALQVPEAAGRLRVTSPAFFRQVHREGCVAQVWTVDRPDDVQRLFGWGADGVVTDRPDLVVPVRDAWQAATTSSRVAGASP